jgi:hypothetical protein
MVKNRYLFYTALALMSLAFLSGAFFGSTFLAPDEQVIEQIEQSELSIESFYVEQLFLDTFKQDNCEVARNRIDHLSRELYLIGQQIDDAQSNYAFVKTKYHTLQMRLYIIIHQMQDSCEFTERVILYYYGRDDPRSQTQGEILDRIHTQYSVRIFAVEKGYVESISFIEDFYGIESTPALVIDYETILERPVEEDELRMILDG